MNGDPRAADERFVWHPIHGGRTLAEVRTELQLELAHDQRAYALAMEGAELDEHAALAPVLGLERKWSPFDLDWAMADPAALAVNIVDFEWEREQRRELIPFAVYRAETMTSTMIGQRLPSNISPRLTLDRATMRVIIPVVVVGIGLIVWVLLRS